MSKFQIRFFLDGSEYAGRLWFAAPRVGDEVMLGPDDDRKAYRVIRVVWGNVDRDFYAHEHQVQRVNVEIREVTDGEGDA